MNTNRRCVNAAVLVALFAFLLIGGSLAGALEPPAPPVPVPFSIAPAGEAPQTPDAGNVTAYDAWTGDSNWVAKGWFFPGETVTYVVGVNNNTDFLRAIGSGSVVTAVSTPIHRGRRQQLWLITITDAQDRLVARGQVRLQNLPPE